jgi:STE24 endopeptidase
MKWLFLTGYLLTFLAGAGLSCLNLAHQKRCSARIPPEFSGKLDKTLLQRSLAYSSAKIRLSLIRTAIETVLLTLFVFGPWLVLYDRWTGVLSDSFILHGVLFFFGLVLVELLLAIPFDLFRTFVLEARYGFNTATIGLWWVDRLKMATLGLVLFAILAACSLWLVQASPAHWWLWVWLFTLFFSLCVMVLSPHVIEPLFHRFEPVNRPELVQRIKALTEKAGIRTGRVFQVDASRRSRHANAFFSGFGPQKRIVLFDTLLQQLETGEIVAVLAHEMGHWRHRHLPKHLLFAAGFSLAATWLGFQLLTRGNLPGLVGLDHTSFPAQVLILSLLATIAGFPFTPLGNWLSRRHEWQADRFAARLTEEPGLLGDALIKLARNSLANVCPHPWYAWYYYSHPPLAERIRALQASVRVDPCRPDSEPE